MKKEESEAVARKETPIEVSRNSFRERLKIITISQDCVAWLLFEKEEAIEVMTS